MSELFKVENLSKQFNHRPVLENVGFSVLSGEVLGLIGPNGSGKTTLLECLSGLIPTNGGDLKQQGNILAASQRNRALFYMPDAIAPWSSQPVRWVLDLFSELYSTSQNVPNLIQALRLEELMSSTVGTLSKGERKRTLLAAALLTTQPALLLDEPFDGLDLRQSRDVMVLLKHYSSKGRTLILSIHQLADVHRVCDRLVLLSAGRVVGEGTIAELRNQVHLPTADIEEIFLALT